LPFLLAGFRFSENGGQLLCHRQVLPVVQATPTFAFDQQATDARLSAIVGPDDRAELDLGIGMAMPRSAAVVQDEAGLLGYFTDAVRRNFFQSDADGDVLVLRLATAHVSFQGAASSFHGFVGAPLVQSGSILVVLFREAEGRGGWLATRVSFAPPLPVRALHELREVVLGGRIIKVAELGWRGP
jgi:hypothetical protein